MRNERTPIQWGLDGRDRRRLRGALRRVKDLRLYRRLQGVLLVACGRGTREAAAVTGMGRPAVYKWLGRYLARRRVDDLREAPRPGRPPAAPAVTDRRIVLAYESDPLALGYMSTEWTAALLARHLSRECGCPITERTLRRRLRALGLAWKRPRHAFGPGRDPNGPQKKGASYAA